MPPLTTHSSASILPAPPPPRGTLADMPTTRPRHVHDASTGWEHFSAISVADEYANGYMQAVSRNAAACGLTISRVSTFEYGNAESAARAVQGLISGGAKTVTLEAEYVFLSPNQLWKRHVLRCIPLYSAVFRCLPIRRIHAVERLAYPTRRIVTANIVLLIAFDVDLPAIFAKADELGMLDAPYAWFAPDAFFPSDLGAMLAAGQRPPRGTGNLYPNLL